jgi:hypothetical protein
MTMAKSSKIECLSTDQQRNNLPSGWLQDIGLPITEPMQAVVDNGAIKDDLLMLPSRESVLPRQRLRVAVHVAETARDRGPNCHPTFTIGNPTADPVGAC